MAQNKAARYIKNVTKSFGYAVLDVSAELNPAIKAFGERNQDLGKTLYESVRDYKSTFKKAKKSISESDVYDFAVSYKRNLFDDLKSGNFYNKQRINADMEYLGGADEDSLRDEFSDMFDDDEWDDKDFVNDMKREKITMNTIESVGEKIANASAEATIRSAEYMVSAQKESTKTLMKHNTAMFQQTLAGMAAINSSLSQLTSVPDVLATHANNSSKFFETSNNLQKETNELLKKILDNVSVSSSGSGNNGRRNGKIGFNDVINYDGTIDIKQYGKAIAQNINNQFGDIAGATKFGDKSMLKSFASSPLQPLMELLVKKSIPGSAKKAMKNFNETLSNIFPALLSQIGFMNNDAADYLKPIFGLDSELKKGINTSKYDKGRVAWDGVARKSLTEIIPGQLSEIISILTGEPPKVFDSKNGKMVSIREGHKYESMRTQQHANNAAYDLLNSFKKGMNKTYFTDARKKKDFDKDLSDFVLALYENGGMPNFKDKDFFNNLGLSLDPLSEKVILQLLNNNSRTNSGRNINLSINRKIANERERQTRESYGAESGESDTLMNYLYNGQFDKYTKKNSMTKSGYSTVKGIFASTDKYGNDLFFYLQELYKYTKEVADNTRYGFSTKGKRGKSNSGSSQSAAFPTGRRGSSSEEEYDYSYEQYYLDAQADKAKSKGYVELDGDLDDDEKVSLMSNFLDEDMYESTSDPKKPNFVDKVRSSKSMPEKVKKLITGTFQFANKPLEAFASLLNSADKRMYDLIYGNATKDVKDLGFIGVFKQDMDAAFDAIKENFIDPTSEFFKKLMGMDTKKSFKENIFGKKGEDGRYTGGKLSGFMNNTKDEFKNFTGKVKDSFVGDFTGKFAYGGQVPRTGLAAVSEGELIIPSEMNPFYHGKTDKAKQNRDETRIANRFFGKFSPGGIVGKDGKSLTDDEGNPIDTREGFYQYLGLNPDIDMGMSDDELMARYKATKASRKASGFVKDTANSFGDALKTIKTEFYDKVKGKTSTETSDTFGQVIDDIKSNHKDYTPGMAVGGGVGGVLGLLIGSPLLGAAVGSAVGLTVKSGKIQEALFGKEEKDGEMSGGLFGKKVSTFITKKLPGIAKYSGAGLLAGTLLPGGPIAGALVGSAVGFAVKSQKVQDMIFGKEEKKDENGNVVEKGKKGIISKDKLKKKLPKAAAGAVMGLLASPIIPGGPVANLILGSAVGFASDTELFKTALFGRKTKDGSREGGLFENIRQGMIVPFTNFFKEQSESIKDWFEEKIKKPVEGAIDPITKHLKMIGNGLKSLVGGKIKRGIKNVGAWMTKTKGAKALRTIGGDLASAAIGTAKGVVGLPFAAIGGLGDRLRSKDVARGNADYMTAEQRIAWRDSHKGLAYTGENAKAAKGKLSDAKSSFKKGRVLTGIGQALNGATRATFGTATSMLKDAGGNIDRFYNDSSKGFDKADEILAGMDVDQLNQLKSALGRYKDASTQNKLDLKQIEDDFKTELSYNRLDASVNRKIIKLATSGKETALDDVKDYVSTLNISDASKKEIIEKMAEKTKRYSKLSANKDDQKTAAEKSAKYMKKTIGIDLTNKNAGKLIDYVNTEINARNSAKEDEEANKTPAEKVSDTIIDENEKYEKAREERHAEIISKINFLANCIYDANGRPEDIRFDSMTDEKSFKDWKSKNSGNKTGAKDSANSNTEKAPGMSENDLDSNSNSDDDEIEDGAEKHIEYKGRILNYKYDKMAHDYVPADQETKRLIAEMDAEENEDNKPLDVMQPEIPDKEEDDDSAGQGIFSNLLGKLSGILPEGITSKLSGLKSISSWIAPISVLLIGLGLSGKLDGVGAKIGDLKLLKGNDTKSALADNTAVTADGKQLQTDEDGNPIKDEDGNYIALDGTIVDGHKLLDVIGSDSSVDRDMKLNMVSGLMRGDGGVAGTTLAWAGKKFVNSKSFNSLKNAGTKVIGGIKSGAETLTKKFLDKKGLGTDAELLGTKETFMMYVGEQLRKIPEVLSKIASKLGGFPVVGPYITKLADNIGIFLDKLYTHIDDIAAKAGKKLSGLCSKLASLVPYIKIAYTVGVGINAYGNAENILGIVDDATIGQKLAAVVLAVVNSIIPVVGDLIPNDVLVNIFMEVAPKMGIDVSDLEKQREKAQEVVDQYNEANSTDYNIEEYNKKVQHKAGIFTKIGDGAKSFVANVKDKGFKNTIKDAGAGLAEKAGDLKDAAVDKVKGAASYISDKFENSVVGEQVKKLIATWKSVKAVVDDTPVLIKDPKSTLKDFFDFSRYENEETGEFNGIAKTVMAAARCVTFGGMIVGKVGAKIKGFADKTVGTIKNSVTNTIQNGTDILQLALKGDIKGVIGYQDGEDSEDNPVNGFTKATLMGAKIEGTIISVVSAIGHKAKDFVLGIINTVKNNVSNASQNTSDIMELAKSGDIQGVMDYQDGEDSEDNPVNGFTKLALGGAKMGGVTLAVFHSVGNKVKEFIGNIVNTVKNNVSNARQNASDIMELAKEGDIEGVIGYQDGEDSEDNPVNGFTKAALVGSKIGAAPIALFHSVSNKIKEFIAEKIGNKETVASVVESVTDMKDYASDGEIGNIWDSKVEDDGTLMSKIANIGLNMSKPVFSIIAIINKLLKPVKDAVDKVKTGAEELSDYVFGDDETGSPSILERAFQGAKDFVAGGGSGIRRRRKYGGATGQFISQLTGGMYGDSSYADEGCAPASAAMLINQTLGGNAASMQSAGDYAVKKGYKVNGDGTKPEYFRDIMSQYGMGSSYTNSRSNIMDNLQNGNPTILLGQDPNNTSKANSPFGVNPHYVVATGTDGNGNVVVNDPESNTPGAVYDKSILNKVSMGVSANGGASRIGSWARGKLHKHLYGGRAVEGMTTAEASSTSVTTNKNGGTMVANDTRSNIWAFLKSKGCSDFATAAIMGNIGWESGGFRADAVERGNGGEGFGLCQWSYGRKTALMSFANQMGKPATSLEVQLNYLWQELTSTESTWISKVSKAYGSAEGYLKCENDLGAMTDFYCDAFERPRADVAHKAERRKYAQDAYNDFSGKTIQLNFTDSGSAASGGIDGSSGMSGSADGSTGSDSSSSGSLFGGIFNKVMKSVYGNDLISGLKNVGLSFGDDEDESSGGEAGSMTGVAGAAASTAANVASNVSGSSSDIVSDAQSYIGKLHYDYGSSSLDDSVGSDCSGFTQNIFAKHGINIPRTAQEQYNSGNGTAVDKSQLQPGDLVFFQSNGRAVGHVGIYAGNDQFIHESSGKKNVTVSNLTSYPQPYVGAKRFAGGSGLLSPSRMLTTSQLFGGASGMEDQSSGNVDAAAAIQSMAAQATTPATTGDNNSDAINLLKQLVENTAAIASIVNILKSIASNGNGQTDLTINNNGGNNIQTQGLQNYGGDSGLKDSVSTLVQSLVSLAME